VAGEIASMSSIASEPSPNEAAATAPERNASGRLLPGNRAAVGAGGHAIRTTCSASSGRLVADAEAGDVAMLAYGLGKPAQAEPEAQAGVSELIAAEYQLWMRPAELVYGERIAALEEENRRLREAEACRPSARSVSP
jgi:hypothetical protein